MVQLKTNEVSLKELFKDLLIELKGFKYQISLKILSKVKNNSELEYSPDYFNCLTKTVINSDYKIDECFSEIICRLENWISHGSGWITEEIVNQYLNISSYLPLSGSTYVKLPAELQHPMKGLINIKNNDNKCFVRCHVRHLNLCGNNLCRITKKDKEIFKDINYSGVDLPVSKKHYGKIEDLNKISVNVFCYENKTFYPVYLSNKKFNDCINLLLVNGHYVYIKDFKRLMFHETKNKGKNTFVRVVYSVLVVKEY